MAAGMSATPDEILALVVFARVVEARSFTAAAAKLGVSKSVVSTRLSGLERQLGVRLLQRTTRKLSLTPEGLALYDRCAKLVALADEAAASAAGASDAPRGLLRVNAPIVFAEEYLAAPIAQYLARHPDTRVDLTMNDRVVDLVAEGVDVAIRVTTALEGASLTARKLAEDHTVLVASPAYLARRERPSAPEDLLQHDCLVYSLLKVEHEWRFRAPGGRGNKEIYSVPIEPRFSAASGSLLRRAALADMGITVLPSFMVASDLAQGRLVTLLGDHFVGVKLGIYAAYAHARPVPSKVRAFVDLLVAHFRAPPWNANR